MKIKKIQLSLTTKNTVSLVLVYLSFDATFSSMHFSNTSQPYNSLLIQIKSPFFLLQIPLHSPTKVYNFLLNGHILTY